MKLRRLLSALYLALIVASCVQSLHPFYTDKELVFDPALVGTWEGTGDNMWIFLKSGEKSYELIYTEKGTPARFAAHLVQLGKYRFLDFFPESPSLTNDLQQAHLLGTHTISRVWLESDSLRIAMLEHAWLKSQLDKKKIVIKHERVDDRIVLTASTRELQRFVIRYAGDGDAFPRPREGMVRKK